MDKGIGLCLEQPILTRNFLSSRIETRTQIDHAGVVQGTTSSRDSLILVSVDANGGEGSSLWAVTTDKLSSLVQLVSAYSRSLDFRDGLGLC